MMHLVSTAHAVTSFGGRGEFFMTPNRCNCGPPHDVAEEVSLRKLAILTLPKPLDPQFSSCARHDAGQP